MLSCLLFIESVCNSSFVVTFFQVCTNRTSGRSSKGQNLEVEPYSQYNNVQFFGFNHRFPLLLFQCGLLSPATWRVVLLWIYELRQCLLRLSIEETEAVEIPTTRRPDWEHQEESKGIGSVLFVETEHLDITITPDLEDAKVNVFWFGSFLLIKVFFYICC